MKGLSVSRRMGLRRRMSHGFFSFRPTRMERARPPRTLCESAVFDPKYALPILALSAGAVPRFWRLLCLQPEPGSTDLRALLKS